MSNDILLQYQCKDLVKSVELLTEIGTVFKMAQNTFNIKWRRLPVALGLQFLVPGHGHILNFQSSTPQKVLGEAPF